MTGDASVLSPGLTFDRTVHRKLVHKHALDEAFVTGFEVRDDSVLLAAVLPRAHSLYCEFPAEDRAPDIALITEVCRQSCFVVAHTKFEVPFTDNRYQFLLQDIECELTGIGELGPERPVEIVVECTIEEIRRRKSEISALVWRFRVTDRARELHVADLRMRMMWIDRGDWRRMRDHMRGGRGLPIVIEAAPPPAPGVAPAEVGRQNRDNVVLQNVSTDGSSFVAQARVDRRHPVLFDHPIDHVYAMVQLEACRQLGLYAHAAKSGFAAGDLELAGFSSRFVSVAELDLPLTITDDCTAAAGGTAESNHKVRLTQGDRLVSEFTLVTRPRPTRGG
jgi:2-oxo-3-(phosphooxy)propyl 3-oxoalkanoate synthase